MSWIDLLATYLFGMKYVIYILAIFLVISGIDDLFIDVSFWFRHFYRKLFVYKKHAYHDHKALYNVTEKPLAIMLPAWQEHGVVAPMAEFAAKTFDYENYHIFVGTYPNDPQTQEEVDEVCARFPNVHKVVCARPGPTSKADCLNNIIAAITLFEEQAKFQFSGFILHDSEDVITAMELRLYNYLVDENDLIQLPVYPFARRWFDFTCGHYIDEFAELHGKDVPIREALVGQVPSAGVGTCFSRQAVQLLIEEGDGIAFDVQSLTEDYDIGIRLKNRGFKEIFVRYPVITEEHQKAHHFLSGKNIRESAVISVREYFPDTFSTAVRQKSRWIIGIVFQGMKNNAWSHDWKMNYFLWRDRKGGLTNIIGFLSIIILLQLGAIWLVDHFNEDAYRFLSAYGNEVWLAILLKINLFLLINRVLQRIVFVKSYYGWWQSILSVPRMFWGNVINFFANVRAIRQVLEMGDSRRVAWDKTTHDFPHIEENSIRLLLGEILIELGALSAEQLAEALQKRSVGQQLGRYLLLNNIISSDQLQQAMAKQAEVEICNVSYNDINDELLSVIPNGVAKRYGIIATKKMKGQLVIASENYLSPVTLGAISRHLKTKVTYEIAPTGLVTALLNGLENTNYREKVGALDTQSQVLFFTSLWSFEALYAELCFINAAVMNQVLIGFENSKLSISDYLLDKNVITLQHKELATTLKVTREMPLDSLLQD